MKHLLRNLYVNFHGMEKVGNTLRNINLDGQPDFSQGTHFNRWFALPSQRGSAGLNHDTDTLSASGSESDVVSRRKEQRTKTTGAGILVLAASS